MNYTNCPICDRLISNNNYNKHVDCCSEQEKNVIDDLWKLEDNLYQCPICNKNFSKKGISSHIWRVHGDGKLHNHKLKGKKSWNYGLTKDTDDRLQKISDERKRKFDLGELVPSFTGKKHTVETKQKISCSISKNNKGGRCKWYEVVHPSGSIVKVQGTWEFRFAKILNMIDPNWIKPSLYDKNHSFKWVDGSNNVHTYTPDFWSPYLNKYFEVKGYWWGNDKQKMEFVVTQNNVKIEIIEKKLLETYEVLLK